MMLSFFAPGYIKEAQLILKNAQKLLHYKRDVLSEVSLADFETTIQRLEKAIKERDRVAVKSASEQLDSQWGSFLPPVSDVGWRENCEVFLVAIVIAIGVRTFFIQPFTIPTGSMQPTLDGIIGHPSSEPPPNLAQQAVDLVVRGRNYVNVVAKSDDVVTGLVERKLIGRLLITVTDIHCTNNTYTAWAPKETLERNFGVGVGRQYSTGDIIARGAVDAGDHVFVDKLSYNLHMPTRGEVFVFSTRNIRRIESGLREHGIEGSEFYIKRLAGLPGDTLRVDSPLLYINGHEAQEFGFQRVMKMMGPGYNGYSNPEKLSAYNLGGALYLTSPADTFSVPQKDYFAMGDNSYNSSDSRYWGTVPEDNLMGRGLFVYWPFYPHWGFVK